MQKKHLLFLIAFTLLQIVFIRLNAQTTKVFSTPGTTQWTVPPCVTSITVKVWGGGGGGGGTSSRQTNTDEEACTQGGGGGGGGFSMRTYSVTPGEVYTIVVGAGGMGGVGTNGNAAAGNGGTGGTSTFSGNATTPFGSLTGYGGNGGGGASAYNNNNGHHIGDNGIGGTGGSGANGTSIFSGGSGSTGSHSAGCVDISGAGGGGAGTTSNGSDGQYIGPCPHTGAMQGGAGGSSNGGKGGDGRKNAITSKDNLNGNPGSLIGGGGGGGGIHLNSWANQWVKTNGGAGADGQVIIEYTVTGAPDDPTISYIAENCTSDGSSTISNYNSSYTYTFTPTGPTIGTNGLIQNATLGTTYTVKVNNGTCDSNPISFTNKAKISTPPTPLISTTPSTCSASGAASVTNYNSSYAYTFSPAGPTVNGSGGITGGVSGTSYTLVATSNGCPSTGVNYTKDTPLSSPPTPTFQSTPASCSQAGTTKVTNYDASFSYTFSPTGPTIATDGTISNTSDDVNYTITANNGSCSSTATFTNNGILAAPVTPIINSIGATCTQDGTSSVSNYNSSYTYAFSPTGPTINGSGSISNTSTGQSYTVTASLPGCSSNPATFTNSPQLSSPTSPTITNTPATCSAAEISTITNYNTSYTYNFSPSGPTINSTGQINNTTANQSYTVTVSISGCPTTPSSSFINAPQLVTPNTPIIVTTAATCSANGSATVSNYSTSYTYSFQPTGPSIDNIGNIIGTSPNTSYTVTASNTNCSSTPSLPFQVDLKLDSPNQPLSISGLQNIPCNSTTQSYIANTLNGATYSWSYSGSGTISGNGTNSISLSNIQSSGTITVTASNACGNGLPTTLDISLSSLDTVKFTNSQDCSNLVTLTASQTQSTYQYQWNQGSTTLGTSSTQSISLEQEGNYTFTLIVKDNNGCQSVFTRDITVYKGFDWNAFEIPNIITPNDDNLNDFIEMPLMSNDCLEYKVLILNRWGNLVKEVTKDNTKFEGKDQQGNNLTEGVYFYKIVSKDIDCESNMYKPKCYGFITIVR